MNKREIIRKFGDQFVDLPYDAGEIGMSGEENLPDERKNPNHWRTAVWEVWCAETKTIYWVHYGTGKMLGSAEDPWGLDGFFPCPVPAYGNTQDKFMIPVPDYVQYRALAAEIERNSRKIDKIVGAINPLGIYDSTMEGLGVALMSGQAKVFPVDNVENLNARGGMSAAVQYVDQSALTLSLIHI